MRALWRQHAAFDAEPASAHIKAAQRAHSGGATTPALACVVCEEPRLEAYEAALLGSGGVGAELLLRLMRGRCAVFRAAGRHDDALPEIRRVAAVLRQAAHAEARLQSWPGTN